MFKPSLEIFIARIPEICAKDTSSIPNEWKESNPLWGHCALVAVLTQEIYGGDIVRASLLHIPTLMHVRSHYANSLPSGALLDGTGRQFGVEYPHQMTFALSSREHVLANADTLARYKVFRERYAKLVVRLSEKRPTREKLPVPRRSPPK